jgi:glycosyltransferase involved in cell wall biosynthesis
VRLLVVLARPPHPEGGASDRCSVALLRGLRANGLDVFALAARPPSWPFGSPPADLPVEIVDAPEGDDWRSRLGRLRRPVGTLGRGPFGRRVLEAARSADAVHLETIETAWCAVGSARPSALHLHYLVRRDRPLGPPWRRQFPRAAEYALAERAALRRHHELVASSPLVASALRAAAPRAEVTLASLSLDPSAYPQAPLEGAVAGMIGTASWQPTRRAIRDLLNDVWPSVLQRVPHATLRLAGRGTEGVRTTVPGVEILGEVSSAAEFLGSLSLLLYPLDRGTGMKVKTLEALAAGVPVVTTPAGAEGLEPSDGLIVESDPARLAESAAALLTDPDQRRRRGAAARAAFLERHAPEVATRPLADLYRRLVSTAPQRVRSAR